MSFSVKRCDSIADIGILVDSSGSLKKLFLKEKEFVKILADVFGIDPDGSRVGIITFSYNAVLSIKLSSLQDKAGFKKAVENLPYMGYTTRIDKALALARDELFLESNGARDVIPKILILLTDGKQSYVGNTVKPSGIAAEIRHKFGATIFAIGIGTQVDRDELTEIANGETRVFLAENFNDLVSTEFVSKFVASACLPGKIFHSFCFH